MEDKLECLWLRVLRSIHKLSSYKYIYTFFNKREEVFWIFIVDLEKVVNEVLHSGRLLALPTNIRLGW